jgi:uncharacterized short protein YbdD (DUF466 family)
MSPRLSFASRWLCATMRLMVGVPRYKDHAEFVRDRQDARFGAAGAACAAAEGWHPSFLL